MWKTQNRKTTTLSNNKSRKPGYKSNKQATRKAKKEKLNRKTIKIGNFHLPSIKQNKIDSYALEFRKDGDPISKTKSCLINDIYDGRGFSFKTSLIPLIPYGPNDPRKEVHLMIFLLDIPTTRLQVLKRSQRVLRSTN